MMAQTPNEEYTYHVGKIDFIVTPVWSLPLHIQAMSSDKYVLHSR